MADLVIKVGTVAPDPAYQDGDILCAFSDRRIAQCHIEHICHPWKPQNRLNNSLCQFWLESVSQFRFDRVSLREVRRTRLADGSSDLLSDTPNASGEALDVSDFVNRRRREFAPDGGTRLPIFGSTDREVWYGGSINTSVSVLEKVWAEIASRTVLTRTNYTKWPLSPIERRHFFAVSTADFTDMLAADFVSSLITTAIDIRGKVVETISKRRRYKLEYRQMVQAGTFPGITLGSIDDRKTECDGRITELNIATVSMKV